MGLFSSPKIPKADFTPLIQERRRGAKKARELIGQIRPENEKIRQEFGRRIGEIGEAGATRRRDTAKTFLGDLGKGVEAAGLKRGNLLRQQILSSQPQQQDALLEAGAATGGVRRGATNRALQQNVQQNQAALNTLTAALDIGSQEAINTALGQVFQTEVGAQLRQQGVDEETARFLAETGRGDVIREFAGGADIEQNKSIDIANIMQSQQESDLARALSKAKVKSARGKALTSLIGTAAGALIGGPALGFGLKGALTGASVGGGFGSNLQALLAS